MSKLKKFQAQAKEEDSRPKESSRVQAENASAVDSTKGLILGSPTEESGNFLKSFLNATPFFDLFEYIADHTCNGKTISVKIAKLKAFHPVFYRFCVFSDITVRGVVVAALIWLAINTAWKVVS